MFSLPGNCFVAETSAVAWWRLCPQACIDHPSCLRHRRHSILFRLTFPLDHGIGKLFSYFHLEPEKWRMILKKIFWPDIVICILCLSFLPLIGNYVLYFYFVFQRINKTYLNFHCFLRLTFDFWLFRWHHLGLLWIVAVPTDFAFC